MSEIDHELSSALRIYADACHDARWDPARKSGKPVPSAPDRFLAAVGPERGPELLNRILALRDEADRVPDPGGPLTAYIDAVYAWAASHPEVDRAAMIHITDPLIFAHR